MPEYFMATGDVASHRRQILHCLIFPLQLLNQEGPGNAFAYLGDDRLIVLWDEDPERACTQAVAGASVVGSEVPRNAGGGIRHFCSAHFSGSEHVGRRDAGRGRAFGRPGTHQPPRGVLPLLLCDG
jgi:hypothetical protein